MEILSNVDVNSRVNRITDYNSFCFENRMYGIRNERPENFKYSIFLSHSHHDSSLVKKIVFLLKTLGVEVYVDWLDDTMPSSTCDKTASRIKQKIKRNHKFIFLATNNSIESRWCNWEIGFGDANKYNDDDIAIFFRTSVNKVKKSIPISHDLINDNLDFYKMILSVVADNSEVITIHNTIKEIQQNLSKLKEIEERIYMRHFL